MPWPNEGSGGHAREMVTDTNTCRCRICSESQPEEDMKEEDAGFKTIAASATTMLRVRSSKVPKKLGVKFLRINRVGVRRIVMQAQVLVRNAGDLTSMEFPKKDGVPGVRKRQGKGHITQIMLNLSRSKRRFKRHVLRHWKVSTQCKTRWLLSSDYLGVAMKTGNGSYV